MGSGKNGRAIVPEPGKNVDIRDYDPADTGGMTKEAALQEIASLPVVAGVSAFLRVEG